MYGMTFDSMSTERQRFILDKLNTWDYGDPPLASLSDKQRDSVDLVEATVAYSIFGDQELVGEPESSFDVFLQREDDVSQLVLDDQEGNIVEYKESLETDVQQCTEILSETQTCVDLLRDLARQHDDVTEKTQSLHHACDTLVKEQSALSQIAEEISNRLGYFNELERVSQKLSSGTLSVKSDSFLPVLARIDECVYFMESHRNYHDSELYLVRFRRCLIKALGIIRNYVEVTLEGVTGQLLACHSSSEENSFTMMYSKFRIAAPRIKGLMDQIDIRAEKDGDYKTLLEDCQATYLSQRDTLVKSSVSHALQELRKMHARDQCSLVRRGCALMVHMCQDEYQLYLNFFPRACSKLDQLLESLCNSLYDVFRPLIIHVNHMETLAELCCILKVEMMENYVYVDPVQLAAFSTILMQMLEDVQERLVYRSHIYIKTEILGYNPGGGDLAYPEKLEMMMDIASSISRQGSVDEHVPNNGSDVPQIGAGAAAVSPADLHGMWYPTVRRTLVCLSKLYRCLDKSIFQGLSQEALTQCVNSLVHASGLISGRKTVLDGQLFLIKHLLILREQITPFHSDFTVTETRLDFTRTKSAARGLFSKKSSVLSLNSYNALLEFMLEGTPEVTEEHLDSRKQIDLHLKKVCESFIQFTTEMLSHNIVSFMDRAQVITDLKAGGETSSSLDDQSWAAANVVADIVSCSNRDMKSKLKSLKKSMSLYLANQDTEQILFRPVKANVTDSYKKLAGFVNCNYSEEDAMIIACPTSEEVTLSMTLKVGASLHLSTSLPP